MKQHKNKLLIIGLAVILVLVGLGIDKGVFGKTSGAKAGQIQLLEREVTWEEIKNMSGIDERFMTLFHLPADTEILGLNLFVTEAFLSPLEDAVALSIEARLATLSSIVCTASRGGITAYFGELGVTNNPVIDGAYCGNNEFDIEIGTGQPPVFPLIDSLTAGKFKFVLSYVVHGK